MEENTTDLLSLSTNFNTEGSPILTENVRVLARDYTIFKIGKYLDVIFDPSDTFFCSFLIF